MLTTYGFPGVRVSGVGYELGEELVTNEKISAIVEAAVSEAFNGDLTEERREKFCTTPSWIEQRTGIKQRYFADSETATSDLAARAILKAAGNGNRSVQEIGFIIVATVTPDYPYSPPTAALVQDKIRFLVEFDNRLWQCLAVDATAACTSFAAALRLGYSLIASGQFGFGAVVGADKMSTTVNFTDREFCVLLGDAAAAVTLEAVPEKESAFWLGPNSLFSWSDGAKGKNIIAAVGGSANPSTVGIMGEMVANKFYRPDKLWQAGRDVFKDMCLLLYSEKNPEKSIIGSALRKTGLSIEGIDIIFFHQANLRIIDSVEKKMRFAGFRGHVFNTIDRFGNTTSASIPLGMAVAYEEGVLKKGMTVLTCAFGGGYTAGTAIFKWSI